MRISVPGSATNRFLLRARLIGGLFHRPGEAAALPALIARPFSDKNGILAHGALPALAASPDRTLFFGRFFSVDSYANVMKRPAFADRNGQSATGTTPEA
jgi:hypothetical protein